MEGAGSPAPFRPSSNEPSIGAVTRNVLLDNVDHADLTVDPRHGAAFGDAVNAAPVFPSEFNEAQRDYPIFLDRAEDGGWQAVVLLGLDRDENLFLDDASGRWDARYVPAAHRRGPFLIGFRGDGAARQPVVLVDLDDPRVAEAGTPAGVRVFRDHGGNSPYLDAVTATLATLHQGIADAPGLYALWEAHGLVEPVAIDVKLDSGTSYRIDRFHAVTPDRLAALDPQALGALNDAGALAPAFLLAASTGNVQRLIERRAG